jgi:hypothetical protein
MATPHNRIVAHFQDGRVLKGSVSDFNAARPTFHLLQSGETESTSVEIRLAELKAVFFVKDLVGNAQYDERKEFDPTSRLPGRKLRVTFSDGEVLVGVTQGYQPGRPGFFLVPADSGSNNERCFIVSASVREVTFL